MINSFLTIDNVEYQEIVIRDPSSRMDSGPHPLPAHTHTHFFVVVVVFRLVEARFTGGLKILYMCLIKYLELEGSLSKVNF